MLSRYSDIWCRRIRSVVALRSRTRRVARDHLPDGREGKRFGHPKKERKSLVNDKIASLPQHGRSKFETLVRGVQKTECVGAKRNESSVVSSQFQASAIRFHLASYRSLPIRRNIRRRPTQKK